MDDGPTSTTNYFGQAIIALTMVSQVLAEALSRVDASHRERLLLDLVEAKKYVAQHGEIGAEVVDSVLQAAGRAGSPWAK